MKRTKNEYNKVVINQNDMVWFKPKYAGRWINGGQFIYYYNSIYYISTA